MYQLYVVLVKKRDPISQKSFLDNISESDTRHLLVHFWETVAEDLSVEFNAAAQGNVKVVFTMFAGPPRL